MERVAETTPTRDELITGVQGLVWQIAREFRPPPGLSAEDLVSEANVALCRSADQFDPGRSAFTTYAAAVARNAMLNAVAHATRDCRGGGRPDAPLQAEGDDGESLPPPADPRASDPAEVAIARESLAPARRKRQLSVREIESALPTPGEVADQVVRLRAAMFASVSGEDVAAVMQAVVREAKAGDPKHAKLLIDLLAPGRSGVTVNQQAIVVQQGDVT